MTFWSIYRKQYRNELIFVGADLVRDFFSILQIEDEIRSYGLVKTGFLFWFQIKLAQQIVHGRPADAEQLSSL